MIVVIDYGMGNMGSILNMLRKVGAEATVSSSLEEIAQADKLILPGVGSFDAGVRRIDEMGLRPLLCRMVMSEKRPILGICLGFQLLGKKSEEGDLPGLGFLDGESKRFNFNGSTKPLKVPHMGWNTIKGSKASPLLQDFDQETRFYFVHSYHVVCRNREDVLTETEYGIPFVSSAERENIVGTQFHPEKSHRYGMRFLQNFVGY